MNKNEFVPYDVALAMKELGFDKECLAIYYDAEDGVKYTEPTWKLLVGGKIDEENEHEVQAPLYQQAFRWFREVHKIEATVSCFYSDKLDIPYEKRQYHAFIIRKGVISKSKYTTYEKAQDACLKKLIGIVKENL